MPCQIPPALGTSQRHPVLQGSCVQVSMPLSLLIKLSDLRTPKKKRYGSLSVAPPSRSSRSTLRLAGPAPDRTTVTTKTPQMRPTFPPHRHDGAHAQPRLRRLAEVPGQHLPATSRKTTKKAIPFRAVAFAQPASSASASGQSQSNTTTRCTVSREDSKARKCTASMNTALSDAACCSHLKLLWGDSRSR